MNGDAARYRGATGQGLYRRVKEDNTLEVDKGKIDRSLIRFPVGEPVIQGEAYSEEVLATVDEVLDAGRCGEGVLELETAESRLSCLVHRGRTYLAGLEEERSFAPVPLVEFPQRARQLQGAFWRLRELELPVALILGVHFWKRPDLQGSTRWIDIDHVLRGLEEDKQDAAVAFEREGTRTLLFLHGGVPARLYFACDEDDSAGGEIAERFLAHVFAPGRPQGRLEVFTNLKLPHDPEAGARFGDLAASAEPPPAVDVVVKLQDGRKVLQRPFYPPTLTIGRDPRADLFLDNLAVSRRHATLGWERGSFILRDLGSANGTRVNDQQVNSAPLAVGDRVRIGKFELALAEPEPVIDVSETMMLPTRSPARPVYLVGEDGSFELQADALIGRGAGVDVRVGGFGVRRVHARLHAVGRGAVEVTCLGGASVKINGRRTKQGKLAVGDKLTVGRSRLWLRWQPGDGKVPGLRSTGSVPPFEGRRS